MFSHYPAQGAGNNVTVAQDWVEDMSEVSAKAFSAACRQWRREAHSFRPSPGQLLEIIAKIEEPMRKRLEAAEEIEVETERMTPRERLNHLKQWQYELELGHVPYDVHVKGHEEITRYLKAEQALVAMEIEQLESQQ